MGYQKFKKNLLDNTGNQPSKFRTKNWVETTIVNTNIQIKIKILMLKSGVCNYINTYILVKETATVPNTAATNVVNKQVIFKNCAPFTDCISEIDNKQVDNAKNIEVVMPMYNFIAYSDDYSKTSGNLWQYYRNKPARKRKPIRSVKVRF